MHPLLTLQIFLMDMEEGDRHVASGQKWHEDLNWAKRLDQGWNLSAVKQVGHICSKSWTTYCIASIVMNPNLWCSSNFLDWGVNIGVGFIYVAAASMMPRITRLGSVSCLH